MQKEVYEFISKKTNDPIIERRTCHVSGEEFAIFQGDVDMLEKLSPVVGGKKYDLPLPVISPEMRHRLHLMFLNKRHVYHTHCDLTLKKTISRIMPELGVKVYTNEAWASDSWDNTDYGIPYNGGNIHEYITTLAWGTPYQDLIGASSNIKNNARYTNHTADIVDSYLVFDAHTIERSAYATKCIKSKDIVDCLGVVNSEWCYECTDCLDMRGCFFCYDCSGCAESYFMENCHGCTNCIGCVNLVQKEYYIYNKIVTKKYFEAYKKTLKVSGRDIDREQWESLQEDMIRKSMHQLGSENIIGENIRGSSRVICCNSMIDAQDCRRCDDMNEVQDCWGVTAYGHASSRLYNSAQVGRYSTLVYMSSGIGKGENVLYCIDAKKSKNCFGCVNIKQKEYCIFNKQYTKEEYKKIVSELIQTMQKKGSWGHFLLPEQSIFPYNDTDAHEIYPPYALQYPDGRKEIYNLEGVGTVILEDEKEHVVNAILDFGGSEKRSIKRRLHMSEVNIDEGIELIYTVDIPLIGDVKDIILKKAIVCEVSKRPFRIIPLELTFYRQHNIPLPKKHPDVRHQERFLKRPGRELYLRACDKTGEKILSVYPEGVPFKVYSEEAYTKEMYG